MKQFFGAFLALLLLTLPARAEESHSPPPGEGVFQSGAMEGPQTIPQPSSQPGPPALTAVPEKAAYQALLAEYISQVPCRLIQITCTLNLERAYCLMIYDRASGAVPQGLVFGLPCNAGISVLHDSASEEVRAVSTKDGSVFTVLPALSQLSPGGRHPAIIPFWI